MERNVQWMPARYGDLVKEERERLGLSQKDLAAAIGATSRKVEAIEASSQRFQTYTLIAYLAHMGMDANYILTGQKHSQLTRAEAEWLEQYRSAMPVDGGLQATGLSSAVNISEGELEIEGALWKSE